MENQQEIQQPIQQEVDGNQQQRVEEQNTDNQGEEVTYDRLKERAHKVY